MKIDKIIFATGNPGKIREIRQILADFSIEVETMAEAGVTGDINENGTTFAENSLIKSRYVCEQTGLPAMADDSGLVVDWMNGEPGVTSARFLGRDTSYDVKNQYIIDQLADAEGDERAARFVCAMSLVLPQAMVDEENAKRAKEGREPVQAEYLCSGVMEGRIGHKIAGENGFGYDPIFFLPQYGKTSAEISPEEKNAISHRGQALRAMESVIGGLLK